MLEKAPQIVLTSTGTLLQGEDPARLTAARARVEGLQTADIINRFCGAFHAKKRVVCWVLAEELVRRGKPPAFWHHHLSATDWSLQQRLDLYCYDVLWIKSAYPAHFKAVFFKRGKRQLTGTEKEFWTETSYAFHSGKRQPWKLVTSLRLSESQQHDCRLLRTAEVAKKHLAIASNRSQVFKALELDLKSLPLSLTFTSDDLKSSLLRRLKIWVCAQMTKSSPAQTAERYLQMTGQIITRQIVADQLMKTKIALKKSGINMAGFLTSEHARI